MKTEFALMVVSSFMGRKTEGAIRFFEYYPNENQIEQVLQAWAATAFTSFDYAYIQKRYVFEETI